MLKVSSVCVSLSVIDFCVCVCVCVFFYIFCLVSVVVTTMFCWIFEQENKTITKLNIGGNRIGPKGAASICDMLKVRLICVMVWFWWFWWVSGVMNIMYWDSVSGDSINIYIFTSLVWFVFVLLEKQETMGPASNSSSIIYIILRFTKSVGWRNIEICRFVSSETCCQYRNIKHQWSIKWAQQTAKKDGSFVGWHILFRFTKKVEMKERNCLTSFRVTLLFPKDCWRLVSCFSKSTNTNQTREVNI